MRKTLQLLLVGIFLVSSLAIYTTTSAAEVGDLPNVDPWEAIEKITNLAFGGLMIVAVIFIIIAAYFFIIMGGTEDGPKKGRQMLTWALVGVAVAILARGIITYIQNFLTS